MGEREREVEEVLERIRPALKHHQGDLKLVKVEGDLVFLRFEGGCSDCPVVDTSLKEVVGIALKGNLPWVKDVKIVSYAPGFGESSL